MPADTVENGNSGPRRSGKLRSDGAWLAESGASVGIGLLPSLSAQSGGDVVPSLPQCPPSYACCSSRASLLVVPEDVSMLTSTGVALSVVVDA